jgi:hypothetical protein
MDEKRLLETLLFYAEKLSDPHAAKQFQEEYNRVGLTFDYYTRALDAAREKLGK